MGSSGATRPVASGLDGDGKREPHLPVREKTLFDRKALRPGDVYTKAPEGEDASHECERRKEGRSDLRGCTGGFFYVEMIKNFFGTESDSNLHVNPLLRV